LIEDATATHLGAVVHNICVVTFDDVVETTNTDALNWAADFAVPDEDIGFELIGKNPNIASLYLLLDIIYLFNRNFLIINTE